MRTAPTTSASRWARITAGLDSLVEYLGGLTDHGPTGVPAILFSNTVSNAPASLCAIEFGLRGPNVTFNQREASSFGALLFSVGAIRHGRAAAMVTGGADLHRGDVLQGP